MKLSNETGLDLGISSSNALSRPNRFVKARVWAWQITTRQNKHPNQSIRCKFDHGFTLTIMGNQQVKYDNFYNISIIWIILEYNRNSPGFTSDNYRTFYRNFYISYQIVVGEWIKIYLVSFAHAHLQGIVYK